VAEKEAIAFGRPSTSNLAGSQRGPSQLQAPLGNTATTLMPHANTHHGVQLPYRSALHDDGICLV
jgi:hypothetical protein